MINIGEELQQLKTRAEKEFGNYLAARYNQHMKTLGKDEELSDVIAEVEDCRHPAKLNGNDTYVDVEYTFEEGMPEGVTLNVGGKEIYLPEEKSNMLNYQLNLRVMRHLIHENQHGDVE